MNPDRNKEIKKAAFADFVIQRINLRLGEGRLTSSEERYIRTIVGPFLESKLQISLPDRIKNQISIFRIMQRDAAAGRLPKTTIDPARFEIVADALEAAVNEDPEGFNQFAVIDGQEQN